MQELRLSNRRDRPDGLENRRRNLAVNADERDSIGPALGFSPP
jgi:hypothetical protein